MNNTLEVLHLNRGSEIEREGIRNELWKTNRMGGYSQVCLYYYGNAFTS